VICFLYKLYSYLEPSRDGGSVVYTTCTPYWGRKDIPSAKDLNISEKRTAVVDAYIRAVDSGIRGRGANDDSDDVAYVGHARQHPDWKEFLGALRTPPEGSADPARLADFAAAKQRSSREWGALDTEEEDADYLAEHGYRDEKTFWHQAVNERAPKEVSFLFSNTAQEELFLYRIMRGKNGTLTILVCLCSTGARNRNRV
jgi:hypothetical protein